MKRNTDLLEVILYVVIVVVLGIASWIKQYLEKTAAKRDQERRAAQPRRPRAAEEQPGTGAERPARSAGPAPGQAHRRPPPPAEPGAPEVERGAGRTAEEPVVSEGIFGEPALSPLEAQRELERALRRRLLRERTAKQRQQPAILAPPVAPGGPGLTADRSALSSTADELRLKPKEEQHGVIEWHDKLSLTDDYDEEHERSVRRSLVPPSAERRLTAMQRLYLTTQIFERRQPGTMPWQRR
ncbi:hypothetical protein ACFL59_14195 [Planctomycetota bacterium]